MHKINAKTAMELEKVKAANGGRISPRRVLEWAQTNQDSHIWTHELEHDPDRAVVKYQLVQCRRLIQAVYAELENKDREALLLRRYVSLPQDRQERTGYRDVHDVLQSTTLRQQMLEQAMRDAEVWRDRYELFAQAELAPIHDAIAAVRSRRKKAQ